MGDPGPLVGTGRDADVYDVGDGRVLRRYRRLPSPGTTEREAVVMEHLRRHGYPVPQVFEADGGDLVMQRLEGATMLDDLEAHPWRLYRHADLWAELHRRLRAVAVGDLVEDDRVPVRFGPPDAVIHLDFHPDNIMLTAAGPMVFDWTNAALGPAAADVADAWLISASATPDGSRWMRAIVRIGRKRLVDRFVDGCGRAEAAALLPVVAERRVADRNLRPDEVDRIRALVAAHS